jgi:uncharacterized protein YciI
MYFIALATDYDATLASHGRVDEQTIAALERLKASGRRLLLVTGRELPDLKRVFDRLDLFDVVVAENGSLLYFPRTQEERPWPHPRVSAQPENSQPYQLNGWYVPRWASKRSAVTSCGRLSTPSGLRFNRPPFRGASRGCAGAAGPGMAADGAGSGAQIAHEQALRALAALRIRHAQQRRRMNGRRHKTSEGRRDKLPALLCQPKGSTQQCLRCRSTEANDRLRRNRGNLSLQPGLAGHDLERPRALCRRRLPRCTHLKCLTALVT